PESRADRATSLPPPIDLGTGWTVRFGDDAPPVPLEHLASWTEDERRRGFSGVATYERTIDVPADLLRAGRDVRLDFGEARPIPSPGPKARLQALLDTPVREAAVVEVNGQRAGAVWCPPYALEIGSLLHPGANALRIRVGNLAINAMSTHALPDYRLLNLRYGVRFEPQDMDGLAPLPSGLLGPLRLVPDRVP
ncbi:MAG TPA: glycoside hydrolase, partial [Vicinamibacteria bacterium]|nr:glycoside hydrolase [Vicinamibacteria bacterium]